MLKSSKIKQIIVIRKDLKMRRGKEIAQGSHASMAFITHRMQENNDGVRMPEQFQKCGDFDLFGYLGLTYPMVEWLKASFAKVTLQANSEEELMAVYNKAKEAALEVHLITDSGVTEFGGIPTKTCLAIGPDLSENIDPVTRNLKLY